MKRFLTGIQTIILLLSVLSVTGVADPLSISPYVSIKEEYSDNVLFSETNRASDFITTLTSGLKVDQDTERMDAGIDLRFDKILFQTYDALNALDYNITGSVSYQLSERLGTRASGRYAKDSQRDRDADTTGLLISGDRETGSISLGTDYLISEVQQVDLSLDFGKSKVEETDTNEKSDTFGIDVSFNRNLSEWVDNTTGILNLSYLHYTVDTENESGAMVSYQEYQSDVFQFSTGVSYNITELYNIFCLAGTSYSRTTEQYTTLGTEYEDDTFGGVLSAGVNYRDLYYDMNLTLSRDMKGAEGTSGAVERTSLSGSIRREITDEFSLSLNASCFLNKNDRQASADTDELTFNIQPGFSYRLHRDFFLSGIYRFTRVKNREADTISERNLVYLLLRKDFEL